VEAPISTWAWKAFGALGFAYWAVQLLSVLKLRQLPSVADMPLDDDRAGWPAVSVIMTARDEEAELEQALRSRLDDDYPALELIVVDDRSSDRTGEIADELAARDSRLKVVHNEDLPEGWLGKVYAMSRGLAVAGGEWVLFSDADVRVKPGTLKRVMAYVIRNDLDHLAVYPDFDLINPMLDNVVTASSRMGLAMAFVWKASDSGSKAAVGVGGFNLVRRAALDRTAGLEWLKLEVADDLTLGQMLKDSGARQQLASGKGCLSVNFYPSMKDAFRGSERGLFTAIGNFSLARCVAIGLGLAAMETATFVLLLRRKSRGLGLLLTGVELASSLAFNDWLDRPAWHALFAPLGTSVMGAMMVRAGVLGKLRGGIYWRGTFYPTELLKPGRRFRP